MKVKGLFRPHYMAWSEQQRIEFQAPEYLRNIIRIISESGLRVYKELMPMKKEQVDLENAVVWIPDSKTPNGIAEVPLTDLACLPDAIEPDGDAAGTSSGCLFGHGVVPTAVRSDNRVSLFRPPTSAPVGAGLVVPLKDWVDHRPGGFHRILTSEECTIAG